MTYSQRIASALHALSLPPGTITTASVKHDPHCPGARGCPACRCVPDITIQLPTGRVHILPDGTIQPTAELN